MKHLRFSAVMWAVMLFIPLVASAQEPTGAACRPVGVCAYLADYLCCRQGYCGKPFPCPPPCNYSTCCVPHCPKPMPAPHCFPLKWCPDCYLPKPAPCCIPKAPCP